MRALTSGSGVPLEGVCNSGAARALHVAGVMPQMMAPVMMAPVMMVPVRLALVKLARVKLARVKFVGCISFAHRALLERDAIAALRRRGILLIGGQGFARAADEAAPSSCRRKIVAATRTKIVAAPLLFGFIPLPRIPDCLSARRAAGVREQPA